jgi:hypothetical protein
MQWIDCPLFLSQSPCQSPPDLLRDLRVTVVELLHPAIQDLIALMRSGFPGMETVKLSLDWRENLQKTMVFTIQFRGFL